MTVVSAKPLLQASIDIDAAPQRVWAVVSDLRRMGEWSPECRRVFVLGELDQGTRTIHLNRRRLVVWPTSARIVQLEPDRAIAWRVLENTAVWSYELEPIEAGTRLTERRELHRMPRLAAWFGSVFLGGIAEHDDELVAGMNQTLTRIKQTVEKS